MLSISPISLYLYNSKIQPIAFGLAIAMMDSILKTFIKAFYLIGGMTTNRWTLMLTTIHLIIHSVAC